MKLSEFQNKIASSDKLVIVDFWAPWCGPCRMTKPILEKLAKEYAGTVIFLPINADDSQDVLAHFGVSGIPTVMAIHNGKLLGRVTGAQNEASYRAMFTGDKPAPVSMSALERVLRLGAGGLLVSYGISTGNWLVAGIGGLVAFLGFYDRCPIWAAITRMFRARQA